MSMRQTFFAVAILFLLSGCAMTQKVAKTFIDTQKKVDYKLADYADPAKIVGESQPRQGPQNVRTFFDLIGNAGKTADHESQWPRVFPHMSGQQVRELF